MTPVPSTRVVLGAPLARLNSFSTRPTVRSSSSSSRLNSLSTRPTVESSASACSFRDRVRVRVSPDFVGGIRMGSTPSEAATAAVAAEDVVVQYVVLRRDLIDTWPLGSVVTQGCHAAVAAVWSHKDDPHTVDYCSPTNIDSMHKVTLEVKGETQLSNLSEKLRTGGIAHKLWIEQPENMPTCLATKPYPKSTVSSFFKKLKLCK